MLDLFAKAIAENNQKDMLRWGPHVRTFRDEMMTRLENQFHWLEPEKADHPRYEERFQEFEKNLSQYTLACDLLDKAQEAL